MSTTKNHSNSIIAFKRKNSIYNKSKVYQIALLLCLAPYLGFSNDSLSIVSERLHAAFNRDNNGCYDVKVSVKRLTKRDFSYKLNTIKLYDDKHISQGDSVKNFIYYSHDENYGYISRDSDKIIFQHDDKSFKNFNWKKGEQIRWINRMSFFFYAPLLTTYNSTNLKKEEHEQFHFSEDSLYYRGSSYRIDDSLTFIKTITISYKPVFRVVIRFEHQNEDILESQIMEYEITESSHPMPIITPKDIYSDVTDMLPQYVQKPIDESDQRQPEAKVKEGSKSILWEALTVAGDTVRSTNVKERFVILDFWYMGCAPCWKAIVGLSKYKSNMSENDIAIIGINHFDISAKEDALSIFKKRGGNYTTLFDIDRQIVKDYELQGYPNIFVIDQKTERIIFRQNGYSEDLEVKIDECIKKAREN